MRFEGRVRKDGKFWLVEIPAFDAFTQGRSKREAYAMAKDLLETMASTAGFEVTVYPKGREAFEIGANRTRVLVALLLRRQRERQGLSLAEAAQRLGQRSRNAYARYEQGKTIPTVEKLEQLLEAIAPDQKIVWRIAA
jgi:predicted RNase H-like HicB family nuclease